MPVRQQRATFNQVNDHVGHRIPRSWTDCRLPLTIPAQVNPFVREKWDQCEAPLRRRQRRELKPIAVAKRVPAFDGTMAALRGCSSRRSGT